MQRLMYSVFLFLFCILYLGANNTAEIQKNLKNLNHVLKTEKEFKGKKNDRIQRLKISLNNSSLELSEQYMLTNMLYNEYSSYNVDSMLIYAHKLCDLAKRIKNKNLVVESELAIANSLLWSGLFKESTEVFQMIDTTETDKITQIDYLSFAFELTFESGLYARYNEIVTKQKRETMIFIINELEGLLPMDNNIILNKKFQLAFHEENYQQALNYGLRLKDIFNQNDTSSLEYSNLLGNIGYNYIGVGDTINGMEYMVRSAIIGINEGSYKYPAMRKIAESAYALGYLKDAHRYIQLSMSNAKFFGSRYRIYEASKILPQVDIDLKNEIENQKKQITYLLILISTTMVILLFFIYLLFKKNKYLNEIKKQLRSQNELLTEKNSNINSIAQELLESNKIKEASIAELFNSNIDMYNKLEILQTNIIRKIKAKQFTDLLDYVIHSQIFTEREGLIDHFDNLFLRLFPNFIDEFNCLLKPENRIELIHPNTLTPELRIFALIRLGIIKNEKIAQFLNYSISTVKNYKTKVKNSSILANEEFEKTIMKITFY